MGHWSWSCDGCDFDNDGTPEIYIACGMLTNNSRTDLMSYFYRQVVAKSPTEVRPRAGVRERVERHQPVGPRRLQLGGPGTEHLLRAPRAGATTIFRGVSGIDVAEDSRAFAFIDIDGDGNLDLVVKNRAGPQVRLFQNARGARAPAAGDLAARDRSPTATPSARAWKWTAR